MPVLDCNECLKLVEHAARKDHPADVPVEHRRQTENKLDVLANYFGAWPNTILNGLRRFPPKAPVDLWIVDLFAGRGWHESESWPEGRRAGTSVAAGFRLMQAVEREWPFEVSGHLVVVEADRAFEEPLHRALDRFGGDTHPKMDVRVIPENYAAVIASIREQSLGGYSLWLWDPYGLESIPFCLVESLFQDRKTEVIVNLAAGDALRVIDQRRAFHKSPHLSAYHSPTLDCLFGGDSWRALPPTLTSTASRERWLADAYAARLPGSLGRQVLALESSTGYSRFLIQAATHPTAVDRLATSYDHVQKLWKPSRAAPKVGDQARQLAKDLAGQEVTPRLVHELGIFPSAALGKVVSICQNAFALGVADRCDEGPDGLVRILPVDDQPSRPVGLFYE